MKKIVYTSVDGNTCIVNPVLGGRRNDESEDDFLSRIQNKDVPKNAIDPHVIDDADIPSDRTFRKAWVIAGDAVGVYMPRAREIHRAFLRVLRTPLLAALDVEYQKADEIGDVEAKAIIASKRQALRDVTVDPAIEQADTPEVLKLVIPDILTKP